MPMSVKDTIKNWDVLIKNRLGPYKIVLKNEETLEYICTAYNYSINTEKAFDYSKCNDNVIVDNARELLMKKKINFKPYITTKAGDIRLKPLSFQKDWKELGW
jgi:hypothetical protein